MGEHLVLWRGEEGEPRAGSDRCLHRAGMLSKGTIENGCLVCPYHGWTYGADGELLRVPSMGGALPAGTRALQTTSAAEEDGYVYVRLEGGSEDFAPFAMPHWGEKGWRHVRLTNRFKNDVTNCVENFVDIPHTSFVHRGLFRSPGTQKLKANVERRGGSVIATYRGETNNLGLFTRFLNPSGREIKHVDAFHMPNVTNVEYEFGPRRRFSITSQSVPAEGGQTIVHTSLAFDYGLWNVVASPFVRWAGQKVIDQDLEVLADQSEVISRTPGAFSHSPADVIHVFIESVRRELESSRDPRRLPDMSQEIEFWV
jgi:phenylpropionate dioxygenase-like ring-hydroxylating dioxygenase large terminal subunit